MPADNGFRVLRVHLDSGQGEVLSFGDRTAALGGSGLAAELFQAYGLPDERFDHPEQPLIFAIGQLTGFYPLMSKVVCGFTSPYHDQYAESHAGGRMALALKCAGFDALLLTGKAPVLSCVLVGSRRIEVKDIHFLAHEDAFHTGRLLRRMYPESPGHRSIARIGPAGENGSSFACINVDTYRHFGRLGAGSVMGNKNCKAVILQGDGNQDIPGGKEYRSLFKSIYKDVTSTKMMSKYHDLGTAQNMTPLNALQSLPWRNLQATQDSRVESISGEHYADEMLLRNTACSGCPVGCIHVGVLREQFADQHRFKYSQVAYDYELLFALGSMLGVTDPSSVLSLIHAVEKQGLDAISTGVALAWATEAQDKKLISVQDTGLELSFGDAETYKAAVWKLGAMSNQFYARLALGVETAVQSYGGEDFACVLGQEMAGYATGESYFTLQSLGFRHSHLDAGAYSLDQEMEDIDPDSTVRFLVQDERARCLLTSLVACLFARSVYKQETIAQCFKALGFSQLADNLELKAEEVQKLRWRARFRSGYRPEDIRIPKRFTEVQTWKGAIEVQRLDEVRAKYQQAIKELGAPEKQGA